MSSSVPSGIQPLKEYLSSLSAPRPFAALLDNPEVHAGARAMDEMRDHVLRQYEQVDATHSFVDENGSIFDCVPVEQQPSLRASGEPPAAPPDLPSLSQVAPETDARRGEPTAQLAPERHDRHGNTMLAPPGTIPMRRLTLEGLARFSSLEQFLLKSPFGGALPPMAAPTGGPSGPQPLPGGQPAGGVAMRGADLRGADLRGADLRMADLRGVDLREADLRGADLRGAIFADAPGAARDMPGAARDLPVPAGSPAQMDFAPPASPAVTHRWAHARQGVANRGGHSFVNVWNPPIVGNQVFSLAQHWYVNGSGAGLQTVEVGWQVYPQKYNEAKPVLFIYFTSGNYAPGTGHYNLDGPGFVQTSNAWAIGGALTGWSTIGGAQRELEIAFFLSDARWWLYVGGETGAHAIGYYPVSLFNGGAMTSGAASIDYGGETVGSTSFPPMGSGAFANAGWQQAAYQRDIRYYPPSGSSQNASLIGVAASPACYTVGVTPFGVPWNHTIFFGGPGGTTC